MPPKLKNLEAHHWAFIAAYTEVKSIRKAALKINRPYETCASWSKDPLIRHEIAKIKANYREETKRNIKDAIVEMDQAVEFSRRTKNANAMVRALEHKHKLEGFVDDGKQPFGAGGSNQFTLNIVGVRPSENVQVQVVGDQPALPSASRDPEETEEVLAEFEPLSEPSMSQDEINSCVQLPEDEGLKDLGL